MKRRSPRLSALAGAAACLLAGCAGMPQSDIKASGSEVRIHDPATLPPQQYEVVERIWVGTWHAAFWLPTYPTEKEAIAAMQAEASRVGADGLVNVSCLDQDRPASSSNTPRILCYGNAIRLRPGKG
jgi:hypothetical protein